MDYIGLIQFQAEPDGSGRIALVPVEPAPDADPADKFVLKITERGETYFVNMMDGTETSTLTGVAALKVLNMNRRDFGGYISFDGTFGPFSREQTNHFMSLADKAVSRRYYDLATQNYALALFDSLRSNPAALDDIQAQPQSTV